MPSEQTDLTELKEGSERFQKLFSVRKHRREPGCIKDRDHCVSQPQTELQIKLHDSPTHLSLSWTTYAQRGTVIEHEIVINKNDYYNENYPTYRTLARCLTLYKDKVLNIFI